MASLKDRLGAAVERIRARLPFVDHLVRTQQHYGSPAVNGSMQAGGVTFFAFLSFFPILALAFFVIGYVVDIYPDARGDLTSAINQVLPGMIGEDDGQISLGTIRDSAGAVGLIGLAGVLYSGLGWLSAMRSALQVVFARPRAARPSFVVGKLRDLMTLAAIGLTLVLSVAVSGAVTGYSARLLDAVGVSRSAAPLLTVLSVVIGLLANMLLFFALFTLLARPDGPRRPLWSGALLGAVGFEALKWASSYLMGATKDQPAFQAFGIALILLVWINYFSRVVMYAASWAHTAPGARAFRDEAAAPDREPTPDEAALTARVEAARSLGPTGPARAPAAAAGPASPAVPSQQVDPRVAFAAGGMTVLGLVALLRRKKG